MTHGLKNLNEIAGDLLLEVGKCEELCKRVGGDNHAMADLLEGYKVGIRELQRRFLKAQMDGSLAYIIHPDVLR